MPALHTCTASRRVYAIRCAAVARVALLLALPVTAACAIPASGAAGPRPTGNAVVFFHPDGFPDAPGGATRSLWQTPLPAAAALSRTRKSERGMRNCALTAA